MVPLAVSDYTFPRREQAVAIMHCTNVDRRPDQREVSQLLIATFRRHSLGGISDSSHAPVDLLMSTIDYHINEKNIRQRLNDNNRRHTIL